MFKTASLDEIVLTRAYRKNLSQMMSTIVIVIWINMNSAQQFRVHFKQNKTEVVITKARAECQKTPAPLLRSRDLQASIRESQLFGTWVWAFEGVGNWLKVTMVTSGPHTHPHTHTIGPPQGSSAPLQTVNALVWSDCNSSPFSQA